MNAGPDKDPTFSAARLVMSDARCRNQHHITVRARTQVRRATLRDWFERAGSEDH
jgi:hypothetical protein